MLWSERIVGLFHEAARLLRYKLWHLEGKERITQDPLSFCFAGTQRNKNFLADLAFDESPKETERGHTWLWDVIKRNGKKCTDSPMIFIELRRPLSHFLPKPEGFYLPSWLKGKFDGPTTAIQLKTSRSIKSDISKIRKYGLTYEISKKPQHFRHYYHHMYLPYIKNVYGEAAAPMGYEQMMKKMNRSELLLIKMRDEYVAAENHLYEKNRVKIWSLGVKDGNRDYLRYGVIGALYYYRYVHLGEKGFEQYDAGLTRPFIKDGVMQYKKKWGFTATKAQPGGFWMRLRVPSPGVISFLQSNPFIFVKKGKLNSAVFLQEIKGFDTDLLARTNHEYRIPGTSDFYLFLFDFAGGGPSTRDVQGGKIHIRSARSLFKPKNRHSLNKN